MEAKTYRKRGTVRALQYGSAASTATIVEFAERAVWFSPDGAATIVAGGYLTPLAIGDWVCRKDDGATFLLSDEKFRETFEETPSAFEERGMEEQRN